MARNWLREIVGYMFGKIPRSFTDYITSAIDPISEKGRMDAAEKALREAKEREMRQALLRREVRDIFTRLGGQK